MWKEDLKFGEVAEDYIYNFLRKKPTTRYITDCSKDKYFQELDIDFMVEKTTGEVIKVEVKHDTQADDTGNIVYELTSNGNPGCLARSHADIVFYLTESRMYWFRLKTLREYLKMVPHETRFGGDNAEFNLLNIDELKERNVLYEITC